VLIGVAVGCDRLIGDPDAVMHLAGQVRNDGQVAVADDARGNDRNEHEDRAVHDEEPTNSG
jgi:hypothetical protein